MGRGMLSIVLALATIVAGVPAGTEPSPWTTHVYQGREYYHNSATKESTYTLPPGVSAQPVEKLDRVEAVAAIQAGVGSARVGQLHQFFHRAWENPSRDVITLAIQADINRLERISLDKIATKWGGPISLAVMMPESTERLQHYLNSTATMAVKNQVDVHAYVVPELWRDYPINKMRNIAIKGVKTDYLMYVDIDEDVVFSMKDYLQRFHTAATKSPGFNLFVITSWQWAVEDAPDISPSSLSQLKQLEQQGKVTVKHPEYKKAYLPPGLDFASWSTMGEPRVVPYADSFEPYFIAKKLWMPDYDERFEGFGGNKSVYTMLLALDGFKFVVLPGVFTFTAETPSQSMKHSAPPNPELINEVWHEIGHERGCENCIPELCVKRCPDLFNLKTNTRKIKVPAKKLALDPAH